MIIFSNRRNSGFVGIQELKDVIEQTPPTNFHPNLEKARRQSRMFSIDYDFMPHNDQEERTVNKYKQVMKPYL